MALPAAPKTTSQSNGQFPHRSQNRSTCATVSDVRGFHLLAGSLLGINGGLLTHGSQDNNV